MFSINRVATLMPGIVLGPHDRGNGSGFVKGPVQTDDGSATFIEEARVVGSSTSTSRGIFTISTDGTALSFGPAPLLSVKPGAHDKVSVTVNSHGLTTGILQIKHTVLYDYRDGMVYEDNNPFTPALDAGDTALIHQHDVLLLVVNTTELYRIAVSSHDPETGDSVVRLHMLNDPDFADIIEVASTKRLSTEISYILPTEAISVHYSTPNIIGSEGRHSVQGEHILGIQPSHLALCRKISGNQSSFWIKDMTNTGQSWIANADGYFFPLPANHGTQISMGHTEIRAGRTLFKTRLGGIIHEWNKLNARTIELSRRGTAIDVLQVPYVQAQPLGQGHFQALVMLTPDDPVQVTIENITYPNGASLASGPHSIRNDDVIKITAPTGDTRRFVFRVDHHTGSYSFEEIRNTQEGSDATLTLPNEPGAMASGAATLLDDDTAQTNIVSPDRAAALLGAQAAAKAARAKPNAGTKPLRAAGTAGSNPAGFQPAPPRRQPTMPPVGGPVRLSPLTDAMATIPVTPRPPEASAPLAVTPDPHENAMRMRINSDGSVRRDDEATQAHMLSPTRLPWANTPTRFRWYDAITLGIFYVARLGLKAVLRRRSA